MDLYDLGLAVAGVAALGAAFLPRLVHRRALSFPIIYVAMGIVLFLLPLDFPEPDPVTFRGPLERLTELGVIIALMGAGLKIDRPLGWGRWKTTWLLLAVTMPLTIAAAAALGYWVVGLPAAVALLLGAVCAPTDPVLASEVQVQEPGTEGKEDEVRFALTSEAGLNDALAFPFTNAALAMAAAAGSNDWIWEWIALDVVYRIGIALVLGIASGRLLAWLLFDFPKGRIERLSEGFVALAATFIAYGVTEVVHGYGFLAVFVAAVSLRNYEREHEYHQTLHDFAEEIERLLTVLLLVLFGGAIASGLLEPLTWQAALVAILLVFVVRPLAGLAALWKRNEPLRERLAISFFGIRGIGSLYYLAHGLNEGGFPGEEALWALVGFVILLSIITHGITATPAMSHLDTQREH